MKITKLTALKIKIPMSNSLVTGFGTIENKATVLVKLETDDGLIGWGEAASLNIPLYNGESVDTCMIVISKYLKPLLLNKEIVDIEEAVKIMSLIKENNIAKTGIETALWMIFSQLEQKSLKTMLGGVKEKIPVGESIGLKNDPEDVIREINLRLKQGFQRIKVHSSHEPERIKVKIRPGNDISIIKDIRSHFGDIPLMVDANSAYTLEKMDIFQELDHYNLLMIEQPLPGDNIVDHATLQNAIKTPICLDESIKSAEDARTAIDLGACKIINIKPGRVGGLLESKKIHDLCVKKGIGMWCGGMLETGIGRAYNIALASLPGFNYASDMSPTKFYFKEDIVDDEFVVEDGYVIVKDTAGLGYNVNEEKIKQYTVEKTE